MSETERHVAVIGTTVDLLRGREIASLSIYGDQPDGEVRVNPSRKRGPTIYGEDVPSLLRDVAGLFEQEDGWEGVVEALEGARR